MPNLTTAITAHAPMPKLVRTPAEFLAVHCPGNQHAAVDLECLIRRAVQTALRDKAEKVAEVMEQP